MSDEPEERSGPPDEDRPARPPPRESPAATRRDTRAWGSRNRLENLANLVTVIVALAAIGLSVWQGYQNRNFYRLSVLPNLEPVEASWDSPARIDSEHFLLPANADSFYAVGYSVRNSGLGPAVLQNLLVYHDGERIFDAAASGEAYRLPQVKADLDRLPFPTLNLNEGYAAGAMLEAGQVHHLITVAVPFPSVDANALDRSPPAIIMDDVLEAYSFVFCYCSVYETDCDTTYLGSAPPVERACGF